MAEFDVYTHYAVGFRRILDAYDSRMTAALKEYELSPNEIAVLGSADGLTTASQIASRHGVSKALVSRSVKSLKERGYITVGVSEVDRREQQIILTPEGEILHRRIEYLNEQFASDMLKSIPQKTRAVFRMTLDKFISDLNGGSDAK